MRRGCPPHPPGGPAVLPTPSRGEVPHRVPPWGASQPLRASPDPRPTSPVLARLPTPGDFRWHFRAGWAPGYSWFSFQPWLLSPERNPWPGLRCGYWRVFSRTQGRTRQRVCAGILAKPEPQRFSRERTGYAQRSRLALGACPDLPFREEALDAL